MLVETPGWKYIDKNELFSCSGMILFQITKIIFYLTYLDASDLTYPTMVRVCPTLKDMFFIFIPCAK